MSLIVHSSVIYENNQSSQTQKKTNRTGKISLRWNNNEKNGRNWFLSTMEWLISLDRWRGIASTLQWSDSRIITI